MGGVVVAGELPCQELCGSLLWNTSGTVETTCRAEQRVSMSLELESGVPGDARGMGVLGLVT